MTTTRRALFFVQLLSFTGASDSGIMGGRESKPHSKPYMVSLQAGGQHGCGGILIRKDFVLTVGHCKNTEMTVVLGAHNIHKIEHSQQRIKVASFIPHPQYNGGFDYDVMLLKLKHAAVVNKYVRPIALPKTDESPRALVNCVVAGWGRTAADKPASNVLKEATEKTQFSFECKTIWQQYFNTTQMICTKSDKKKGGICQGDSGGPLICNAKPLGLMAYTLENKCSNAKSPAVFMKVPFFVPWIKSVLQRF